jgi:hypothetical protein
MSTITYEVNGGKAISSISGVTQIPKPLPTSIKTGNTFVAWYLDSSLGTEARAGASISGDTTLYAKYQEINKDIVDTVRIFNQNINKWIADEYGSIIRIGKLISYLADEYGIFVVTDNVTADSENPTTIALNGTAQLLFSANTNYTLSTLATINNVETETYDSSTGIITLANPFDFVSIGLTATKNNTLELNNTDIGYQEGTTLFLTYNTPFDEVNGGSMTSENGNTLYGGTYQIWDNGGNEVNGNTEQT